MTKSFKIFIWLVAAMLLVCGSSFWILNSSTVEDYFYMYRRSEEADLALAFTIALKRNHLSAYDMVQPKLHPKVEDWIATHLQQLCADPANLMLSGSGTHGGFQVAYGCLNIKNQWYNLNVDDIIIQDGKVVDWGEVEESY